MTTESQPKRRWFQVHLSTAVVLMVVAGICIYLNVRKTTFNLGERPFNYERSSEQHETYGWPWKCLTREEGIVEDYKFRPISDSPLGSELSSDGGLRCCRISSADDNSHIL